MPAAHIWIGVLVQEDRSLKFLDAELTRSELLEFVVPVVWSSHVVECSVGGVQVSYADE